ncbi:hypothetical protein QE109_12000 [Fusibacter bizertensis]|uniref:Uncharacterized protein n=1 Tax=Fusibacter bizertensis TaxID=1488331 RepID=A0ABT6NEM7_9FIRM|nr:hypothetical protein [Fusibacter bizertensis]MDH8678878.1 hypothetical protein [Fusibacter bizertensis]
MDQGGIYIPKELGGRADKSRNRFEIRAVIYYLLKVFEEKIDYVILEALGDDERGIDLPNSSFKKLFMLV